MMHLDRMVDMIGSSGMCANDIFYYRFVVVNILFVGCFCINNFKLLRDLFVQVPGGAVY